MNDLIMPDLLENIRIVLVEPAGARNVGSVARVMKNMALKHLVLVNPQCDHLGEEARQMAVHAANVLESARIVTTLPDGLVGCRRAIATTGRPRTLATTLESPSAALPWLLGNAFEPDTAALIFGPEDRGLNNEELNQAHRFLCIPSNSEYPSLNLAQAVGVCCYELFRQVKGQPFEPLNDSLAKHDPLPLNPELAPAPLDQMEGFYEQLETLLLEIGYVYPHTAESRMEKFRRLFNRAMPTSQEVAMLRGVLSQVKWAIETRKPQ